MIGRALVVAGCLALLPVGPNVRAERIGADALETSDICTELLWYRGDRHGFTNAVTRICFAAARQVSHPEFPKEVDVALMTLKAIRNYADAIG